MAYIQDNNGKQKDYRSRLDVIRNPGMNHMSRTRTKIDRFKTASKTDGVTKTGTGRRRVKAYDGAYVAEPRRQKQSGFNIAGALMQHIHNFVIDMDLTSLYPSIMLIQNLSPKTFVGKLFFKEHIDIPKYQIQFIDKNEQREYKMNANDFFMECYTGKHWWAMMEIFMKLPTTDQIFAHIEEHIDDFS
jgi:hypothetical protein